MARRKSLRVQDNEARIADAIEAYYSRQCSKLYTTLNKAHQEATYEAREHWFIVLQAKSQERNYALCNTYDMDGSGIRIGTSQGNREVVDATMRTHWKVIPGRQGSLYVMAAGEHRPRWRMNHILPLDTAIVVKSRLLSMDIPNPTARHLRRPARLLGRLAVLYGPVWLTIIVVFAIYVRVGLYIYSQLKQLRAVGVASDWTEGINQIADTSVTERYVLGPVPPNLYQGYSQADRSGALRQQNVCVNSISRHSGPVSLMNNDVSQVPSSINRLYTIADPQYLSFGLNYAAAFVVPWQGFWNSVIFFTISRSEIKALLGQFRHGLVLRGLTAAEGVTTGRPTVTPKSRQDFPRELFQGCVGKNGPKRQGPRRKTRRVAQRDQGSYAVAADRMHAWVTPWADYAPTDGADCGVDAAQTSGSTTGEPPARGN
ncbi:hypothetical protein V495_00595 [Pseudogymnoascus sp. VKM F-4514 (FW-929)]|nr:hypothetical protein V495_00595 [Pseudogymnoascus sp. VKM F-4514 (FW-929)]KFY66019.1 hypothetical protein V497_01125 [Pseudogymnoascus sp. VKM F-4516 (FW-969)]